MTLSSDKQNNTGLSHVNKNNVFRVKNKMSSQNSHTINYCFIFIIVDQIIKIK